MFGRGLIVIDHCHECEWEESCKEIDYEMQYCCRFKNIACKYNRENWGGFGWAVEDESWIRLCAHQFPQTDQTGKCKQYEEM